MYENVFIIVSLFLQPVPMVHYRRGTRSRPQVKIPKQYHDDYEDVMQQQQQQLLVPSPPPAVEPMEDPLIPIDIIKSEPIDVVENDISSFSVVETDEPSSFADDPIADDGPPTLIAQEMVNPLAGAEEEPQQDEQQQQQSMETDGDDGFVPIRLSVAENVEHEKTTVEDSVASIQIAECHSMNLDEQEEENRMIDEGVETIVTTDLIKTDEEDTIQTQTVVEEMEEKIDIDLKEEESVVENHVTVMLEVQKSDGGTGPLENDVQ